MSASEETVGHDRTDVWNKIWQRATRTKKHSMFSIKRTAQHIFQMAQSKDKWLNSLSPHCEQARGVFGDVITGLETGLDQAGGFFLSGTHLHRIRGDESSATGKWNCLPKSHSSVNQCYRGLAHGDGGGRSGLGQDILCRSLLWRL